METGSVGGGPPDTANETKERSESTVSDGTRPNARKRTVQHKFDHTELYHQVSCESSLGCLEDRYEIFREVGRGQFASVLIAKDKHFEDRFVAIKKISKNGFMMRAATNFMEEAEIMKKLDHPNICRLHETYDSNKTLYIVMEYLEGGEVFERMEEEDGCVDERTCSHIIGQTASAIAFAHKRNISHRDLKPENICFVSRDPDDHTVKVIDWGLAFHLQGAAKMSSSVGTSTYAAPEVLDADEKSVYEKECDLWSLGVVTYVMLSGMPPFSGTHNSQMRKMKWERYDLKRGPWAKISSDAKHFIKGLLKSRPRQRMPIDRVLEHNWLASASFMKAAPPEIGREVFANLKHFRQTSALYSVCAAAVARHLDHSCLEDIHKVFVGLDENKDGVLTIDEIKRGFETFGEVADLGELKETFALLDLDGNGSIDYTEFCAAGIGDFVAQQDHALWAAFKVFDVDDDDGYITREEFEQVINKLDTRQEWNPEVRQEWDHLFAQHGKISFHEWRKMVRSHALGNIPLDECSPFISKADAAEKENVSEDSGRQIYASLHKFHKLQTRGSLLAQDASSCCAGGVMGSVCVVL
uniref:non-specific serine/threonine protein kinase n=1 Tax=Noctiluca scintillans TaxID=2966 RepID=A0A7S1B0Z9_NOCSC